MSNNKKKLSRQQNPLANPNNSSKNFIARAQSFSGPIPHPDILLKYNGIIPDAADRILKMAEKQATHRQYIEKWAVISGSLLSPLGVICALIIALAGLYFGYYLIQGGRVLEGSIFAGGGVGSTVIAFIYGTRSRKEERLRRDQQNKDLIRR